MYLEHESIHFDINLINKIDELFLYTLFILRIY